MTWLESGAIAAALVALLCFASITQIEQNQYGLVLNWVTKSIEKRVYHGGTHFIGFWNKCVIFPATVQTIEFSDRFGFNTAQALHTRTKEGLGLHLSISFQYKLIPEEIPALYALTNSQYEALFTRIARDQLLEAASDYEGPQYWMERQRIGDHMRDLVDHQLKSSHATLWGLQLLIIDLPDAYENSITMTQVQQQLIKTKQNEQVASSIRADTEVMQAEFARQIKVTQARADANYSLTTKLAQAEAAQRRISAEANVLRYVREKLRLSSAGTIRYQELDAFSALANATFLANVVPAAPVISAGSLTSGGGLFLQTNASKPLRAVVATATEVPRRQSFLAAHRPP